MLALYQFATSPFTEKVRRAFHYKGLDFEVNEVARARAALEGKNNITAWIDRVDAAAPK